VNVIFTRIQISTNVNFLKSLTQILLVLRAARIFKLLKSMNGVQKLIITLQKIVPSMLNILGLLFLIFFIFAILGTYLFKNVRAGESLNDDYINFKNFANSFLLMFRMSTGEDWHMIMYDCMRDNMYSFVFFVIYVVLV